jgi:hypothetical protein
VEPLGGFEVALWELWGGFRVALGWLWGAYRLAINTLCGGFDVALMWLWLACRGQNQNKTPLIQIPLQNLSSPFLLSALCFCESVALGDFAGCLCGA